MGVLDVLKKRGQRIIAPLAPALAAMSLFVTPVAAQEKPALEKTTVLKETSQNSSMDAMIQSVLSTKKTREELETTPLGKMLKDKKGKYLLQKHEEEDGTVFWVLFRPKEATTEFYYYPEGNFRAYFNANTRFCFGFYPDGITKTHECMGDGAPLKEYYKNGQLKTTPVPQPKNLYNYDVYSEDGKVIASHKSSSVYKETSRTADSINWSMITTSDWILFNTKTGEKTAKYTLYDSGPQGQGILVKITLFDENGKAKQISMSPNSFPRIRFRYRKYGDIRPASYNALRNIFDHIEKRNATKRAATIAASSRQDK